MARIVARDADLEFRVSAERYTTVKTAIAHWLRPQPTLVRTIQALRGINLVVDSGERIGLIGANGAGKSSLLRLIAGIYPPQRGEIRVEGHICPLFEFATGFEMEANGWDNMRMRALLLGMSAKEIDRRIPEIAEFTRLGEFLDIPVRCYSSGMLLRLAFATSTAVDPQILLLDEVMAAGDAAFQESARARLNQLVERASIVVFATHSLDQLPMFCSRTVLLRKGEIVADGPTREIVDKYRKQVSDAAVEYAHAQDPTAGPGTQEHPSGTG